MGLIKFEITNRFSGACQFVAEIECAEDAPMPIKLGLAVKWAVKTRANLAGANLADANLADANLARANLAGANLADANLARANLADANLARANLAGANLARAYLADANLVGAYLADAKWRDGIVISKAPIQIHGLTWPVTILDEHMQIGCELHRLSDWEAFDDARIGRMDARLAKKFWSENKDGLLSIARGAGRSFAPAVEADASHQQEMADEG